MVENPVVIVTGASRGLGAAIVRQLSRMGAAVTLTARSLAPLEEEAQKIIAAGGDALVFPADLSVEADCGQVVSHTLERFGRIDALVNNAGMIEPIAPICDANPQQWQQNWTINFLSPVILSRMCLPSLRENSGRIINISSGAAVNPIPGCGAYSTAKAALHHFTQTLAAEEPQVTSLSIRPGVVDTEMQATIREKGKGHMGESNYDRLNGMYERGELLPPDKPGQAIAVLALYAPHDLSGQMLLWNDPQVEELERNR